MMSKTVVFGAKLMKGCRYQGWATAIGSEPPLMLVADTKEELVDRFEIIAGYAPNEKRIYKVSVFPGWTRSRKTRALRKERDEQFPELRRA